MTVVRALLGASALVVILGCVCACGWFTAALPRKAASAGGSIAPVLLLMPINRLGLRYMLPIGIATQVVLLPWRSDNRVTSVVWWPLVLLAGAAVFVAHLRVDAHVTQRFGYSRGLTRDQERQGRSKPQPPRHAPRQDAVD